MNASASTPYALATLVVAALFAAVYLSAARLFRLGHLGRGFLSFAAGIAVGYTFVHVLPGLAEMRNLQAASTSGFPVLFPEYSVYLWSMLGFVLFHGLELMAAGLRDERQAAAERAEGEAVTPWQYRVHVGGFAAYTWCLTYLLVAREKEPLALGLYAVAMGLHIFPVACNLSREYGAAYDRRGARILALAALAGWGCGMLFEIPGRQLAILLALVAGGVIVNTMISEIPQERKGRYLPFLVGTAVYAALLLMVSHFEKGE